MVAQLLAIAVAAVRLVWLPPELQVLAATEPQEQHPALAVVGVALGALHRA
jgi:hypothetical protein